MSQRVATTAIDTDKGTTRDKQLRLKAQWKSGKTHDWDIALCISFVTNNAAAPEVYLPPLSAPIAVLPYQP